MNKTKTCSNCGTTKPLAAFANDRRNIGGRCGQCRICNGARSAAWRRANPGRAREGIAAWEMANPKRLRESKVAWRAKNQELLRKCRAKWVSANPELHRECRVAWQRDNPEKCRAHSAVNRAKKSGTLIPQPCDACGSTKDIQAHHDSYDRDRWLDVRWLCPQCHGAYHAENRDRMQRIAGKGAG